MGKRANPFRCFNSSPEVIRLAVQMSTVTAQRRGPAVRAQHRYLLGNGAVLVEQVWADVRGRYSATTGEPYTWISALALAPRQGVREDQRRAVDHEGEILESCVTQKRDKLAALRFLEEALKRHGRAETIVTDGLRPYPAVM